MKRREASRLFAELQENPSQVTGRELADILYQLQNDASHVSVGFEDGSLRIASGMDVPLYFKFVGSESEALDQVNISKRIAEKIDTLPNSRLRAIKFYAAGEFIVSETIDGIRVSQSDPATRAGYVSEVSRLLQLFTQPFLFTPRAKPYEYHKKFSASLGRLIGRDSRFSRFDSLRSGINGLKAHATVPFFDLSEDNSKTADDLFYLCDWTRTTRNLVHPVHEGALLAAGGLHAGLPEEFFAPLRNLYDFSGDQFGAAVSYQVIRSADLSSHGTPLDLLGIETHPFEDVQRTLARFEDLRRS